MHVLLIGADGMLGRAVHASAPSGVSVQPSTVADLDITSEAQVRAALEAKPAWVINCAAWTRVDDAEEHEAEATRVNGEAVGIIGRAAATCAVRVLHISTDYVFDGTLDRPYREDDPPNPQGAYGRSKLAGERALAASGCQWTMLRTQWLYGGGPSFVRTMWQRARARARVRVVKDQFGAPTHVGDLAAVIWRLVAGGARGAGGPGGPAEATGIWHAAAGGFTSWYEVARAIYMGAGADPALVTPCSTLEYGARAPRPANGRLDTTKLGGMRPFDVALTEALHPSQCGVLGP